MFSVVERFVTNKNDQDNSKAVECSQDSKILTPIDLSNEKPSDKWSQLRSDQEAECPQVDFASAFVEEEYVVDDSETNHLGRSVEEALKGSTCCKSSVG
jgi:hypothetical protein